jgi:hypothetical protein
MRLLCLVMLLLMQGWASSAELGRLFLSPSQRAAIDDARRNLNREQDIPEALARDGNNAEQPLAEELPSETVTVNGYVSRSAGAATVWINGHDGTAGQLSPPARDGQRVRVPLANGTGQIALKPGQSFDSGSQQVSDAYEQRLQPEP